MTNRAFQLAAAICLASLFFLNGCAADRIVDHSFEFDAHFDSPDIEILDYQYGETKSPGARGKRSPEDKHIRQQFGIHGEMLLPDFLFVQWKIKASGEIFDDRVDLKSLLPRDMESKTVRFIVRKDQLFVYLVSKNPKRSPAFPPQWQFGTPDLVRQLYPSTPHKAGGLS